MIAMDVAQRAHALTTQLLTPEPAANGVHGASNGYTAEPHVGASPDRAWPTLDPAALHGLAGDIVRAIAPHTEGDPVAILLNVLTMFGSAVGSTPHAAVGAAKHRANLFVVHTGESARSRKGTAHAEVERLMRLATDASGWPSRIMGGLSSGEGLIFAVRDATYKTSKEGKEVMDDPGADDKRLLIVEPEFSSPLRVASRDGNTLTEILRRAWDGNDLRTLTRNSPLCATTPHISILGHITRDELLRELTATNQVNGFANRFLFACVKRSQLLPDGGALPESEVAVLAHRVRGAIEAARQRSVVQRDAAARTMWHQVYPALTTERSGLLGSLTARAEAQVLRLSLDYALLDGADVITCPHLEAALAVWEYCEDSVAWIFGDATGDPIADRVLAALRSNPGGLTQTALSELFGRNLSAAKLATALETLITLEKIAASKTETRGRPGTVWEAIA